MKLMGFEAGNTLFKFCEKRAFCEELASGRIYMKANGYFRQLEDTYRGDPADSRLKVEKTGKPLCVQLSSGKQFHMETVEETVYGVDQDDQLPVFCAVMFDGAIVEPPADGAVSTRFCSAFVQEMRQFGSYVVCVDLDEFLESVQFHALERGYQCLHSKIHYFDTRSVFSPIADACEAMQCFPFAFFQKEPSYRRQNEWRCILQSYGHAIIPEGKDHYTLCAEPFESARILKAEELLVSEIML